MVATIPRFISNFSLMYKTGLFNKLAIKNAKTKEEQDFYMTLSNLVLQKEQAKVIGK